MDRHQRMMNWTLSSRARLLFRTARWWSMTGEAAFCSTVRETVQHMLASTYR